MSQATEWADMTGGRGLQTESEREAIAGEASSSYRYKTRSFFRDRLEEVAKDIDLLAEHDEELLDELREVVCDGDE
jgi:putative heme iron utilization protein